MQVFIALSTLLTLTNCGLIEHDHEDHKATSYQNIHIEHFHSVPTYIKKEDAHLLEHPISKGKTSSKVEVHHGGKHDHGYAIADTESDLHNHDVSSSLGHEYNLGENYENHAHLTAEHGDVGHGYAVAEGGHGFEQAVYAHQEAAAHQEASAGHEGHSLYHGLDHGYSGGEIGGHDASGLGHYQ